LLTATGSPASAPNSGAEVFHVADFGAVGDGTTDDTAAIQETINAAFTQAVAGAGYGRVAFDAKTYLLAAAPVRPVEGDSQAAGQLLIPRRTNGAIVTIELSGAGTQQGMQFAGDEPQTGGTVLKSTAIADWSGHQIGMPPAVLAAPRGMDGPGFNRVTVTIRGIAIAVPPDPTVTGLNLLWAPQVRLDSVRVCTTDPLVRATEPTHLWSTGIVLPGGGNNAVVFLRDVHIMGFWTGLLFSEHTDASSVLVFACKIALAPFGRSLHTARFGLVSVEWCPTVIAQVDWELGRIAAPHGDQLAMSLLDIEEFTGAGTSTWAALEYHVYDPNSVYHGWISMARSDTSIPLTLAGAAHLDIKQLHLT
jgi:hypothetical protein